MIEKIPDQIPVQTGEWGGTTFDIIPKETFGMACRKINELCDIINDITDWIKRTDETIVKYGIKPIENATVSKMENVDPYAEQRKWVGKVCVFWDNDDTQEFSYGVLTAIDTDFGVGYSCNGEYEYDNCEPVKPDDDIIYKGE